MDKVFYCVLAIALLFDFNNLHTPGSALEMKSRIKKFKGKDISEYPKDIRNKGIESGIYFILMIIGLLTFQWWAFVSLFILSLIPKRFKPIIVIDAAISILIVLFIIINKFHFHYTPF